MAATLETLKKGNADELAFLDELAGTSTVKEQEAEKPCNEAEKAKGRPQQMKALVKGNAEELAFLNELAGVSPEDAAGPSVPAKDEEGATMPTGEAVEPNVKDDSGPGPSEAGAPSEQAGTSSGLADVKPKEEQEDEETYELDAQELLDAFMGGGDSAKQESAADDTDVFQDFLSELRAVDRDNEVNRILWAFKLNPFEKMNLPFTATESDVRKQYRKISLLIHPDKCKHPQASEAFEVLQLAQKELLNEEVRTGLMRVLEYARDKVRAERRKATKHDSAMRLATILHGKGREGVEEDWEKTDDFHEKWKLMSRDVLAKAEFRKRKLNKRIREEEERLTIEEKEEAQERKKNRKEKKEWLDKRTDRIDSWRDWNKTKGTKKTGGIKAPKIKTSDAERSYVQRATTEQFVGNYKKKAPK